MSLGADGAYAGRMSRQGSAVATSTRHAVVTDAPIAVDDLEAAVASSRHGAVLTFIGVVRDHDHGRPVASLRYEGHPTAARVLGELVADVLTRHPGVVCATEHRVGDLGIGDIAFVVVVAASHRSAAFDACRDVVDTVKDGLPVWKLQRFTDGTQEWVNCA